MTSRPDTGPSPRAPVARLLLASCIGIVLLSCEDGAAPTAAPPATPPATPPPAPQPPNAPANLRVSATGQDFVQWSWDAVPGAIVYVVQVSGDETFDDSDPVHVTVETTFTATGLPPETSVYVRVAAASGTAEDPLVGAWTAQVAGVTAAPPPPASPPGLVVSATTENSITWTWNAVAGATGYEVQFSRDAEFTEADEVIDVSGQTVYRREGLSAETRVYLRVRSYRETGDDRLRSGWTVALPAMTLVPAIPVTIPDTGLRRAITVALGKRADDPVTRRELSTLSRLTARSSQIVDLTGLEWATGLRVLELATNSISDISPLAGLTGLEQLNLHQNNISDISPLARLTGLDVLFLGGNNISDISPLARLTGLERVYLHQNNISDISPLAGLTGLELLILERNSISDISLLARLTGLEDLRLSNNDISDISPLERLTGLERLFVGRTNISDISPLARLTGLELLYLDETNISDVSPLARMTGLEQLFLAGNDISDISPLVRLTGLKVLSLAGINISDISPLAGMTGLEELLLHYNNISDISPLARLTRLYGLFLHQNNISDVSALARLTGLKRLFLAGNNISDISPLAGLTELWDLSLSDNDISDISPLAGLTGLERAYLHQNDISDISPLAGLTGLRHLDLTSNNVADLTPIAHLPWAEGDVLYAGNNPLRRASLDLLLRLADAGVAVDYNLALEDEFPGSQLVQLIGDNVLAISVPEDLTEKNVHNGLPLEAYAQEIYRWFADEFDYLIFLSDLSSIEDFNGRVYSGVYQAVMNDTEGTGVDIFFDSGPGSAGKLRGMLHFPYRTGLWWGPGLHELMHTWANYAVPTAVWAHWGFSSANGQLGGFDRDNLVELGGGRYRAGGFGTVANGGNSVPYSPIELYFAGLIPPEEVPDLWVAVDGERADDGSFTASDVRDYSIEDIVAEHGRRVPNSSTAQRHFRAMVVLLMNDGSISVMQAEQLSEQVSAFSHPGDDDEYLYNYYEATGGRGTIAMDGLSRFRRSRSSLLLTPPPPFGRIPPPHICWPDGRGGIRHQFTSSPAALSPDELVRHSMGVSPRER